MLYDRLPEDQTVNQSQQTPRWLQAEIDEIYKQSEAMSDKLYTQASRARQAGDDVEADSLAYQAKMIDRETAQRVMELEMESARQQRKAERSLQAIRDQIKELEKQITDITGAKIAYKWRLRKTDSVTGERVVVADFIHRADAEARAAVIPKSQRPIVALQFTDNDY